MLPRHTWPVGGRPMTSPRLFRILVRNQTVNEDMEKGWARLSAPLHWVYHVLRRNTVQGSRANIAAHYDLGNDFYRLFSG